MTGHVARVRACIRTAFLCGDLAAEDIAAMPSVPVDGGLGDLLTAAAAAPAARGRLAEGERRVQHHLARAENAVAAFSDEIEALERAAAHLRDGTQLPAGLPQEVALAVLALRGTEEGSATGRIMEDELQHARRALAGCRTQLAKARSAARCAATGRAANLALKLADPDAAELSARHRAALDQHHREHLARNRRAA